MDAVLSFAFEYACVLFGGLIAAFAVLIWLVGRPNRWWKWPVQAGLIGSIGIAALAIWFFAAVAAALDHRLASLTFTEYGSSATHKLADYRGKVVFLNYWGTWCPPCREEIPNINKLVDAYAGKDVVFVAVTDEEAETINRFLTKQPIRAMVARFASEKPSSGIESFVYDGRPTTMIIDAEGKVAQRIIGGKSFAEFDKAIRAAM